MIGSRLTCFVLAAMFSFSGWMMAVGPASAAPVDRVLPPTSVANSADIKLPIVNVRHRGGGRMYYRHGGGFRGGYRGGYGRGYRRSYAHGYRRSYRGGFRGPRYATGRYYRRHHGPRYRHRRPGYRHYYGGYWYGWPWWAGAVAYPYYNDYYYNDDYYADDYYAPAVGGRCGAIHRACVARWGYPGPNYDGCMRYDNCAPR